MAWLEGYSYRKKIKISVISGQLIQNQVIPLYIAETTEGHVNLNEGSAKFPSGKNDSGDIAITDVDEITPLNFWVEGVIGTTPSRKAVIWLKIPATYDAGQDFLAYVYYGNPNASNLSNGDDTFSLFDDFDTNSLDTSKWTVLEGSVSVANSIAAIQNGSKFESISLFNPGNMARFRFQGTQTTYNALQQGRFQSPGNTTTGPENCVVLNRYNDLEGLYPYYVLITRENGNINRVNTDVLWDNNWHIGTLWWITGTPDNAKAQVDNSNIVQSAVYVPDASLTFSFYTRGTNFNETMNIDWVFIAPYHEATISVTEVEIVSGTKGKILGQPGLYKKSYFRV